MFTTSLAMIAVPLLMPRAQGDGGDVPPVQEDSSVLVNEVLFDTLGADGGTEWIELFNAGATDVDLSAASLVDHAGALLWQGPAATMPAGGYVIVQLGPVVSEDLDTDPSDGYACFFTGQAPADVLPNDAGGVALLLGGGVQDAVFWGTSGPPSGPGLDAAVAAGQWPSGGYVDVGFNGGALEEGDTIGRSVSSLDTNAVDDWATACGPNGALPTPGDPNGMYLAGEFDLIRFAQEQVNAALTFVGTSEGSSISVLKASNANRVVDDPDQVGGFVVHADHTFTIDHSGTQTVLTGHLDTTYERSGTPLATAYGVSVVGMLSDGNGTSLQLDVKVQRSGFHSLTRVQNEVTTWTWTSGGVASTSTVNRTFVQLRTSPTTWQIGDLRSGTDWRDPSPFSVYGLTFRTKLADGSYQDAGTITSPFPAMPPAPGLTQTTTGTLTTTTDATWDLDADGQMSKVFTKRSMQLADLNGNVLVNTALVKDAPEVVKRTAGAPYSPQGSWNLSFSALEQYGFPTINPGSPTISRGFDVDQTDWLDPTGEFFSQGTATFDYQGSHAASFYVDGPLQQTCGCGCNQPGCNCGGAKPVKKKSPGGMIAVVGTSAVCVYGAAVTAPTVVGAAIIGGLCALGTYLWW